MFYNLDNLNENSNSSVNKVLAFNGFQNFITNLEKYFFSRATLRENNSNNGRINLIIELDCNLSLSEMIYHFDKGNWGTFNQSAFSFADEIYALGDEINNEVDIDEFSLFLKDTTIIINKIYNQSIPEQLENILFALCNNHSSLTKCSTEIPFEIFIPVFEENITDNNGPINRLTNGNNNKKSEYFDFWGLYFESEEDAIIFELGRSFVNNADLFMLNE